MHKLRESVQPRALLRVRNLGVRMGVDVNNRIIPLADVDFDVREGETVGLLGESGAGKTTLAMAILRLLPPSSCVEGSIEFKEMQLLTIAESELRKIRGSQLSLVYQDSSMLNPVLRVGDQIVEVLRAHFTWTRQQYRLKTMSLLREVGLGDAERIYAAFPHQLSGGQRQRIAIAQAMACQPALVIADEPTASLDPETSSEILDLLGGLKRRFQTSFLLISHDLSVLTNLADRIMIMYAGRIVERGSRDEVWQQQFHPYTTALFKCGFWPNDPDVSKRRMPTIAGQAPDPSGVRGGCAFVNRCPDRMGICCARTPEETPVSDTHAVRCFKFGG